MCGAQRTALGLCRVMDDNLQDLNQSSSLGVAKRASLGKRNRKKLATHTGWMWSRNVCVPQKKKKWSGYFQMDSPSSSSRCCPNLQAHSGDEQGKGLLRILQGQDLGQVVRGQTFSLLDPRNSKGCSSFFTEQANIFSPTAGLTLQPSKVLQHLLL